MKGLSSLPVFKHRTPHPTDSFLSRMFSLSGPRSEESVPAFYYHRFPQLVGPFIKVNSDASPAPATSQSHNDSHYPDGCLVAEPQSSEVGADVGGRPGRRHLCPRPTGASWVARGPRWAGSWQKRWPSAPHKPTSHVDPIHPRRRRKQGDLNTHPPRGLSG